MNLHDKACIVTGGGRGIGRATALRLCAAGANVIVSARTAVDLEETARLCRDRTGRCVPCVTDMGDRAQIRALVDYAVSEFGRLDVLVNNAGVAPLSPVASMSDDDFETLISVNVNAVFYACRVAWPVLKESRGTIVNISSVAADDPFPGFAAYGASKAWVNTFTRALAAEGRPHGLKVFAVAPGAVETRMLRTPFPSFPAEKTLDPDDIAAVIELLLDPRSQYATGEIIHVKK